tara:strand:- start:624 stop:956 length:333 start_codon:yes stop_codon:yes gene_type:complete
VDIRKLFIIFFFSLCFLFPNEETITLSSDEMTKLVEKIEKLQSDISIYMDIVKQDSITISKQDSLIWVLNKKYELCEERLVEVEPKIWENKWMYFLYGIVVKEGIKSIGE